MKILYEDDAVLIVEKPPGVLCEPGKGEDVLSLLGGGLFLVHRLDRDTGGALALAKTRAAAAALSAAVQEKRLVKEYWAVVSGIPEEEGVFRDLLFRDAARNKSYVVTRLRRGVREAELAYRRTAVCDRFSLVRVRLGTGRTHQIRVQFASRGFPLVGDGRYGGTPICRIALWSCRLSVPQPFTGQTVTAISRPPEEYPWTLFRRELDGDL